MKSNDFQPAVAAIGKVLKVGKNLIHQISVVTNIRTMSNAAACKMPIQDHDHIGVFSQPRPHLLAISIAGAHILRVTNILPQIVRSQVRMRNHDRFFVRIGRQNRLSPVKRRAARSKLQHKKQVLLAADGQHAIKVFIAAGRKISLVISFPCIARGSKPMVEPNHAPALGIRRIIVMIADGKLIWNPGIVEDANGGISILLLCIAGAIIHNVAYAQHHLNILALGIVGNPLGLAVHYLRKELGFILRVRQNNDGEILGKDHWAEGQKQTEKQKNCRTNTKGRHGKTFTEEAADGSECRSVAASCEVVRSLQS